jgi:hypothetical protein
MDRNDFELFEKCAIMIPSPIQLETKMFVLKNAFSGKEMVQWLKENKFCPDTHSSMTVGQKFLNLGYISHCSSGTILRK